MAEKYGNTPGNINNRGIVTISDGWIYFLGVYKVREDGKTDFTVINDDSRGPQGMYLNVVGDWMFYMSQENGHIFKVRTDGDMERAPVTPTRLNNDKSSNVIVAGEWIYYTNEDDGSKIYKIRVDGSGRQKVNGDESGYLNIVGDTIYYVNYGDSARKATGCIYKIDVNGNDRTKLCDESAHSVNVIGDLIYYGNASKGHTFWQIRTDGSANQQLLGDMQGGSWNVVGDFVYYRSAATNGQKLCKIRLDGTGGQELSKEAANFINVVGDWVYYTAGETFPGEIYKVSTNGGESKCLTGGSGPNPVEMLEMALQSGNADIMMEAVKYFVGASRPEMLEPLQQQLGSIPEAHRKEQLSGLIQSWLEGMK